MLISCLLDCLLASLVEGGVMGDGWWVMGDGRCKGRCERANDQ